MLIAGCGGGSAPPDREQVGSVVLTYARAFGAGDGGKACDQLTPAGRAGFLKLVSVLADTHDCATGMHLLRQAIGPQAAAALHAARVSNVRLSGSTATATITAGAEGAVVRLAKQGGRWRLVAAPGIAR